MRKGKRREAGRRAVAVAPVPPAPSSMGRRALAAAGAREAACPRARLCSEATGRCGRDWRGHAGFARTAAPAAGRARMAARRRSFCACEPLLPPLPPSSKRADIRAHKMAWKEYSDDACCYWGACGMFGCRSACGWRERVRSTATRSRAGSITSETQCGSDAARRYVHATTGASSRLRNGLSDGSAAERSPSAMAA
jgi:hypothetical protein